MPATKLRRYRPRAGRFVIAVQLALDTKGFTYRKWGAEQRCKHGDWLVDNQGELYTVDKKVFARTYKRLRPGAYVKATPVWAEIADKDGSIRTKEGRSHYRRGDYLVYNDKSRRDGYCMSAVRFKAWYKPA